MINLTIQNTIQSTIKNTLGNLSEKFITQLFVPVGSDSFITADNKIFKVRVDMSTLLYLFAEDQRGVWYDPSDLATMYQESTGVTAVTADGQPVGLMLDKSPNTLNASQPVSTKRPTYKETPDRLEIDLVDDALLFDVPTGGIDGYMVIGTNDGTASYGVSLPAGSYELGGDYFPSNTINGFLLREGSVSQADLSKVESDFVSKGAKASYGDVTNFTRYWLNKGITEFPLIDTSSGTNFFAAWYGNNLTSFPLLDTSSGTSFSNAWRDNFSLSDFPANMFDNCICTNFTNAFANTSLTQASIDGVLVSIESNGAFNGRLDQVGGSAPSATGQTAIDAMRSRGWTITVTGGY